jgi:purine catabolism regulator
VPLWLEHLLEDPGLGLELVAGRGGLRQRGPIRWVHASEIPDPTPWLEGGEILLTTGMGVADSPELQRKLIAGLDGRGCAGVGFGVGICLDDVPDAMREEAEARELPLFTVPYAVPFIAVTKSISRHLFEEHYATLRSAVDLHRHVLATVLGGTGLRGVLDTVGRALPEHGCLVYDYYGQLLASHRPEGTDAPDPDAVWEHVRSHLHDVERVEIPIGPLTAVGAAVRLGEQVEAYVVLLGDRSPHEPELLLLEQALTGVSLELARGLSAREAHRVRVDDLLDEVAAGRLGGQALAERLARIGVEADAGYAAVCVAVPARGGPAARERSLAAALEDALAPHGPPVVGRRDGQLLAVVPIDTPLESVAAAVRARGWPHVVLGRSRPRSDADGLASALREAQVAASVPGPDEQGVREIGSLGLPGLLAGIDDSLGAEAFVEHTLGPVLAHDRAEGTDLVATLSAYQRHGCRPGPAAEELCVHRHTLAYRLERVRDLTGRDPRDGAHLLAFGLALELHARSAGSGTG